MFSSPIRKRQIHATQLASEQNLCNGSCSPRVKRGTRKVVIRDPLNSAKKNKTGDKFSKSFIKHDHQLRRATQSEWNIFEKVKHEHGIDSENKTGKESLHSLLNSLDNMSHKKTIPGNLSTNTSPLRQKVKRIFKDSMSRRRDYPVRQDNVVLENPTKSYLDIIQSMKDFNKIILDHASSILKPSLLFCDDARDRYLLDQSVDLDQFICCLNMIEEKVNRLKKSENIHRHNLRRQSSEDDCDLQIKLESEIRIHKYKLLFSSCKNATKEVVKFMAHSLNNTNSLDYQEAREKTEIIENVTNSEMMASYNELKQASELYSETKGKNFNCSSPKCRSFSERILNSYHKRKASMSNGQVLESEYRQKNVVASSDWIDKHENGLMGCSNNQLSIDNINVCPCLSEYLSINMRKAENADADEPKFENYTYEINNGSAKQFTKMKIKISQEGLDLLKTNEEVKANYPYNRSFEVKMTKDKFIRTFRMDAIKNKVALKADTSYDNIYCNARQTMQYLPKSKSKPTANLFNSTLLDCKEGEYSKKWKETEPSETTQLNLLHSLMFNTNILIGNENTEPQKRKCSKLDSSINNSSSYSQISCESLNELKRKLNGDDEDKTPEKYPERNMRKKNSSRTQYSIANQPKAIIANCQTSKQVNFKLSEERGGQNQILPNSTNGGIVSPKPVMKAKSQNEVTASKCHIF